MCGKKKKMMEVKNIMAEKVVIISVETKAVWYSRLLICNW
jgi:hypothetical protein